MVAAFDVSRPPGARMDDSPQLHLGGVGFARTGYPWMYTQSVFFAVMWHTLQSVV